MKVSNLLVAVAAAGPVRRIEGRPGTLQDGLPLLELGRVGRVLGDVALALAVDAEPLSVEVYQESPDDAA